MDSADYDITGVGPPLVLVHGWPFHKGSFRKIIPILSAHFTCYSFNSLGLGAHGCQKSDDMSFQGHARRLVEFADEMKLETFSILAHDTGGTFARIAAADHPQRIEKLIILNTEMPNHRPPFIPLYRYLSFLPGFKFSLSQLLYSNLYLKSAMGFGGCFYDKSLIDEEFTSLFAAHWTTNTIRFRGLQRYLQGLNFSTLETLPDIHRKIQAPTQFIWGQQDVTFPVDLARGMAKNMPSCEDFVEIEKTCFLVHEEKPHEVASYAIRFLSK